MLTDLIKSIGVKCKIQTHRRIGKCQRIGCTEVWGEMGNVVIFTHGEKNDIGAANAKGTLKCERFQDAATIQ